MTPTYIIVTPSGMKATKEVPPYKPNREDYGTTPEAHEAYENESIDYKAYLIAYIDRAIDVDPKDMEKVSHLLYMSVNPDTDKGIWYVNNYPYSLDFEIEIVEMEKSGPVIYSDGSGEIVKVARLVEPKQGKEFQGCFKCTTMHTCTGNKKCKQEQSAQGEKPIKVFVKKNGDYWTTNFEVGVQGFRIDNGGERSKKEAEWYAKNLKIAFNNAGKSATIEPVTDQEELIELRKIVGSQQEEIEMLKHENEILVRREETKP